MENIKALEDDGIRAYVSLPDLGERNEYLPPKAFTYDSNKDQYLCPQGQELKLVSRRLSEAVLIYQAEAAICNACSLKGQCTGSANGRHIFRSIYGSYIEKVKGYQRLPAHKRAMRKRKVWLEPLFGEAKVLHGLRRFRLRGLHKVNMEGLMVATGQNLKRLLKHQGVWGWPDVLSLTVHLNSPRIRLIPTLLHCLVPRCPIALKARPMTDKEQPELLRLSKSRTEPARLVERARIIWYASQGLRVPGIASLLNIGEDTVRLWLKRFNVKSLQGLADEPRSGRPATYSREQVGEVIATALTDPQSLGQPFASWTLDRLEVYLNEQKGIPIKRSRISELLIEEDLRWRSQETWFGERVDPDFAAKRGRLWRFTAGRLRAMWRYAWTEMGPEAAKSFPGQQLVPAPAMNGRASRAKQEIDYGRRGKGYVFGAFRPADGEALTEPYGQRSIANYVEFLEKVDNWLEPMAERIFGIVDNLNIHRATDVLLFSLAHPRWEFVFQPKYAAYLNLIEPWWKILRSLALKGRCFETWEEIGQAVKKATAYWNAHKHPFIWGRRRRHQPRRHSGIALLPNVA